jgi:tetratricopeptide (TPR) repeat protein
LGLDINLIKGIIILTRRLTMRVLPLYPNGHKRAQARISGLVLIVLFWVVGISYAQTVEEYYNKGVEYGAQGKFKEAENEFKRALEIDQFYGPAKECLKLTEDALAKRVENEVAIHLFKGAIYGNKGMWDEAITEFKKAIALNPNFAEAHYNLAVSYYYKGQHGLAIKHCDQAIELGYKVHPALLDALKPYRK